MSEAKHTPGPWTLIPAEEYCGEDPDLDGSFTHPASIEGADGNAVCTFGSEDGSGTLFENEADYHLIVAAPDLLIAVQRCLNFIEGTEAEFGEEFECGNIARAAIAKAEGRP